MLFPFLDRFRDLGLLILRFGFGFMFIIVHGGPKIIAGPERWERLGSAMSNIGIDFLPTFWGFIASFTEFFGGIFLLLGLFFRPSLFFLTFTMFIAVMLNIERNGTLAGAAHPLEVGIVFLALIFIGPGKYSLDNILQLKLKKKEEEKDAASRDEKEEEKVRPLPK